MTDIVQTFTYRNNTYQLPVCPERYVRVDSYDELLWLEGELKDKTIDYVAYDLETTGLDRDAVAFGLVLCAGRNEKPGKVFWIRWIEGTPPVIEKVKKGRSTIKQVTTPGELHDIWFEDQAKYKVLHRIITFLFQDNSAPKIIMHNGKFDIRLTRQTWGVQWSRDMEPTCPFNDTMIMHNVQRRGLVRIDSSSLKELGSRYLNHKDRWDYILNQMFEDMLIAKKVRRPDDVPRNYAWMPEKIMMPYSCADGELTYKLFFKLRDEFSKFNAPLQYIYKLERTIVPIIADIGFKGQYINVEYFKMLDTYMAARQEELLAELQAVFSDELNPNSSKQLQDILYGEYDEKQKKYTGGLGLPIIKRTKTGAPSTDKETLDTLAERFDMPELQLIALHNRYKSIRTGFVRKWLDTMYIEPDNSGATIRTDLQQIVETGRFSSRSPNLQNVPNDARRHFPNQMPDGTDLSIRKGVIAPEGFLYVKCDYAQFELRVLANACEDAKFCSMINDGIDMHSWLAVGVFKSELADTAKADRSIIDKYHKPDHPLTKKYKLPWEYWAVSSKATDRLKYMRNIVKNPSFAIVYGAGAAKIAVTAGISEHEAELLKEVYFGSFPVLADWSHRTRMIALRTRIVETLFGRQRVVQPPSEKAKQIAKEKGAFVKDAMYNASVNTIIQGTSADILKHAMYHMHKILRGKKSYMCATIHDEVQVYLHHTELDLINPLVECMERRYLPEKYPVPMIAETSASSTSWAACRELDHSKDLTEQLTAIWEKRNA